MCVEGSQLTEMRANSSAPGHHCLVKWFDLHFTCHGLRVSVQPLPFILTAMWLWRSSILSSGTYSENRVHNVPTPSKNKKETQNNPLHFMWLVKPWYSTQARTVWDRKVDLNNGYGYKYPKHNIIKLNTAIYLKIHNDQVGFIPRMQGYFNIWKLSF